MRALRAIVLAIALSLAFAPASAQKSMDDALCQADLVGPQGATFGWVNLFRLGDSSGPVTREEFRYGFEAWRLRRGEEFDPDDVISFDAVWPLKDGRLNGSFPMQEFSANSGNFDDLPLPARVEVRLDGKSVGVMNYRRDGDLVVATDTDGKEIWRGVGVGVFSAPHGIMPDIYGHRRIEFYAYTPDGKLVRQSHADLPDWKWLARKVSGAARKARSSKSCGPQIMI